MASLDESMVTIEREYFETLIRRAQLNTDEPYAHPYKVSITKSEYNGLKDTAARYANLRNNLLRGGVGEDTIDLLSQDDASIQGDGTDVATAEGAETENGGVRLDTPVSLDTPVRLETPIRLETPVRLETPRVPSLYPRATPRLAADQYISLSKTFKGTRAQARPFRNQDWADVDADVISDNESISVDGPLEGPNGHTQMDEPVQPPRFERDCQRTIQLGNLGEGVTHGDIANVVRGGQLLNIFLRTHERSATVSFLRSTDAWAFFDHARRHDLYIKNKRVEVRWSDRHFTLPGYVASKIRGGATRNLIVRRCDPRNTEESIREDLEHIHNLVIIKVEFIGGSCFISTNSVHNAMFARTCMMSRTKYKGSKIEWAADECAQSLERLPPPKPRKEVPPPKKTIITMANRFHLLNLDEDDGDEDEITSSFRAKRSVGITA